MHAHIMLHNSTLTLQAHSRPGLGCRQSAILCRVVPQGTQGGRLLHVSAAVQRPAVAAVSTEVETIEVEMKVEGLMCDGCTSRVHDAVAGMEGVESVRVKLSSGLATVQVRAVDNMEAAFVQLPRLLNAVNALGFQAEPYFGSEDDGDIE